MSKMSETSLAIKELKRCGEALIVISDSLADLFRGDGEPHADDQLEVETPTPVKEPPLTLEAVRAVLADKSRVGYTAQIRSLLEKYGASRLSGIDPANYMGLIADVEGLTDAT
jgi:hypothetical protein